MTGNFSDKVGQRVDLPQKTNGNGISQNPMGHQEENGDLQPWPIGMNFRLEVKRHGSDLLKASH